MTSFGISGHQKAPQAAWELLVARLPGIFGDPPFLGVSSLAAGADQRFADAVVRLGGELHVVVPSEDYESSFETREDRGRFEYLLASATQVERLDYGEPGEDAFLAAGRHVVDLCDVLVAVWDGLPAKGKGGTADVVDYARELGKPVEVVWPAGVCR